MPWMRCSITPPALFASSGPDAAVVSSSSVTPEPARASRKRPNDIEDVILVKFVCLVSVHTTSVNGAQFSEASKFQVLLCLNVLQVVVLMESRHTNVWSRQSDSQIVPHMFPHFCLKIVWFRGVIMVFLILSVHSGNDSLNVPFSSMIRFSLTAAVREEMDGRDR